MAIDPDLARALRRPDLPPSVDRWRLELPPRAERRTSAEEWAGCLVLVESGRLEVDCAGGGFRSFEAGDLLALGWLPLERLRNVGDEAVRLLAIRRRGPPPAEPFLHVTRASEEIEQ